MTASPTCCHHEFLARGIECPEICFMPAGTLVDQRVQFEMDLIET